MLLQELYLAPVEAPENTNTLGDGLRHGETDKGSVIFRMTARSWGGRGGDKWGDV